MGFPGHIAGVLFLVLLVSGCSAIYKPQNEVIPAENHSGYGMSEFSRQHAFGDSLVILSFSGGGTRAAALSYGVMQELRHTYLPGSTTRQTLLDDVDLISGVSGGSFTAAYYGLYGKDIFQHYEHRFLRQGVQTSLIRQLLTPTYWWRSMFSGFDRTEMAIEYYDTFVFQRKTFADMKRDGHPFILINATDLGAGNRFTFTQDIFDLICSDLDQLPVARAVTASSAVPVAFPPVVMQNYAGECNTVRSDLLLMSDEARLVDRRLHEQLESYRSYLNREERPFIHLVDGGISDNLGLRAAREVMSRVWEAPHNKEDFDAIRRVVVILVNAEVRPASSIEKTAAKPGIVDTVDAVSNAQIRHYNLETRLLLEEAGDKYSREFGKQFYFIDINFQSFQQKSFKRFFNNLPTSLELTNEEVDTLIEGGRLLLRESPAYRLLLADIGIDDSITEIGQRSVDQLNRLIQPAQPNLPR